MVTEKQDAIAKKGEGEDGGKMIDLMDMHSQLASSEARKATAWARSSGSPSRRMGTARTIALMTFSPASEVSTMCSRRGVFVGPGQTALEVTPDRATSLATDLVKAIRPPLAPE